ncbi:hypothetical protein N665_0304s0008, partial [Sinapis alba]
MKAPNVCFFLLIVALTKFQSAHSQDQSGFISLDCGLVPKDTTYVEKTTNITYTSDGAYIDSGVVGRIDETLRTIFQRQVWNVRSFPNGQRNCYNFNLTRNQKYLIRGSFQYGNYDGLNQLPSFDLHIEMGNSFIHEIIHVLTQDRLQVCLVKTGETTPFISSLELRPLNNSTYDTQSGSLMTVNRVYFSHTPSFIRYDEDIHDRTWLPNIKENTTSIRTDLPVDTNNPYDVPQLVAKTAMIPENPTQPLNLRWTLDEITAQSYIYMHFAEIQNLEANETREFNITYNGGLRWFSFFSPPRFGISTLYNPRSVSSPDGTFEFTFTMTSNSTLPPLINGLEVYKVLDILQLETDQNEGDVCAPKVFLWESVNCSYPDSEPPFIISLNLTESELTGTITPEISKLTRLRELDLSNNDLSGDIPPFFADMNSLKLINLSGNSKLNRTVPSAIRQRIGNKSLQLL